MNNMEVFMEIDNDKKIELWNAYCEDMNNYDNIVYINDDMFLQDFYGDDVYKLASELNSHEYKTTDSYVKFTIYGLKSYESVWDVLDDICNDDEYIEYAIANYNE